MSSFSFSGGVEVLGFISPTDTNDTYPVIDPLYGIDGFRNVNTLSDLNTIPNLRRRAGMVVGISGGTQYYKLNPGPWVGTISDWSIFNSGGGSFTGGTVTGNTIFTQGVTATTISGGTFYGDGSNLTNTPDKYITDLSFNNSNYNLTVTRNDLWSDTVSLSILSSDMTITGGTYNGGTGTATFTNNSGGTFNVSGFLVGYTDHYVTGFTYSANTFYIYDNSGNTFSTSINTMTGLTVNGILSATIISGGTLYGDGSNLTGISSGLNVGTTQITNGTDTRVLFQSGTTLQQDGNFTFDPTLKQLTLMAGGTLSTDIPFRVRNSGNTANILTVTGNDFVGINTDTQVTNGNSTTIGLRVNSGGVNYLNLWNSGGVSIGNNAVATYFNSVGNTVTSVAIGLNTYSWRNSVAIGPSSTANSTSTISIGQSNTVGGSSGTRLIALGSSIDSSTSSGGGSDNIAIGNNLITGRDNYLNIVIGTHLGNRFNLGGSLNVNKNIYIGGYLDQPANSRNNIITLGYGVSSVSKITPSIDNSFQVYFSDNERSFFVNKNSNVVLRSLQSLTSGTNFDASATNTITISTGTTPSTNIVGSAQIYVTDRGGVTGRASVHFRSEDGTINVLGDLSGIGTSSPQARLDVRATGSSSSDIAFRVRNSGDTADLISFRSDGSQWIQSVPFRHAALLTGTNNTTQGLFLGYNVASLSTTSTNAVIIGRGSGAILQGNGNTIIGDGFSHGTVSNSIGLGRGVFVNGSNQFVSGSESYPTNTWLVSTGGEVITGANLRGLDFKVSGTAAGPSNISASSYPVRFYSPNGTGSGLGSNIQFHVAPSNTGGAAFNRNIFSEIFTIRGDADGLNHYQLSTPRIPSSNITDGYIQYSADRGGVAGKASAHFRSEDGTINVLGDLSGIGTSSPQARLDIRAQGTLSTDIAFRIRNSGDTANLVSVTGEGVLNLANLGDTSRIAINATTLGQLAIAIGSGQSGLRTTCVGFGSTANGQDGTIFGYGNNGVSLGACGIIFGSSNTHTVGIVVGSSNSGSGSVIVGSNNAIGGSGPTNNAMFVFGAGITETSGNALLPGTFMFGSYTTTGNKAGLTFKSRNKNHLLLGYDIMNATYSSQNGTNWLGVKSGTAPDGAIDAFQLYSADITAGNAAPHFRTENGSIVKLYQETTGVTTSTLISNAGTTITDTDTFDGYTLQQVVKALRNLGVLQ